MASCGAEHLMVVANFESSNSGNIFLLSGVGALALTLTLNKLMAIADNIVRAQQLKPKKATSSIGL